MEFTTHNISVTLCLPPDTDTPGFAEEELSKLLETKLITQSSSLVKPSVIANQLFKDALVSMNETFSFMEYLLVTCQRWDSHIIWFF